MATDDLLTMLAGEWRGDEQIATTPWGAGGPAVGHVVARLDLGGRVLLQDYREEREGKPSLQAHAVLAAGAADGEYALYWFDSYGFVPERPAPGHRDGDRLVFLRSSPRGQTRHTYLLQDASSYRLTLDCSFDGGVQWERLMSGDYRRVG